MTPAGLDTNRLLKMIGYCIAAGFAAGFTAVATGAPTKAAIATGAAAVATSIGTYWSTSPKNGQVVDAAKAAEQQGDTAQ